MFIYNTLPQFKFHKIHIDDVLYNVRIHIVCINSKERIISNENLARNINVIYKYFPSYFHGSHSSASVNEIVYNIATKWICKSSSTFSCMQDAEISSPYRIVYCKKRQKQTRLWFRSRKPTKCFFYQGKKNTRKCRNVFHFSKGSIFLQMYIRNIKYAKQIPTTISNRSVELPI